MKRLFVITSLLVFIFLTNSAYAHVLITDSSRTKGAIVHISPDDNPIAGQPATLFLDTQNIDLGESTRAKMIVTGYDVSEEVDGRLDDSSIRFKYTFPAQGLYKMLFVVTSNSGSYTFTLNWHVSRGTVSSALDRPHYVWAEITLLASCIGFGLLIVIMLGRWRRIWRQSTF